MSSIVSRCSVPGQLPPSTVIEQGKISSIHDLGHLQIIDWNRINGYWDNNPTRAMNILKNWLVNKAAYTVIRVDMAQYPVTKFWPGWAHAGTHEPLGRLFWNAFHATQIGTLEFSDSPDFEGVIIATDKVKIPFSGDIGQVSISTFIFSMLQLSTTDLWISIPDAHTQVIIQPLINLRRYWHKACAAYLSSKEKQPIGKLLLGKPCQKYVQETLW